MTINRNRSAWAGSILAALGAWCWTCAAAAGDQPLPVDEALASIVVKPEFVVELVAAEPLVADPVAIDFGPDGRLWVADMTDYGQYVHDEFEQTGAVRVLADRDGDGRYDESTVFQGGLRFPTDVKAWRRGVIVCDAPDVIYLEDTDGDGQADVRKVLLTGFSTDNAQARVNSLRWGLDNWLYGSCGLLGGKVRSFAGHEVEISRDFRFRPDTGELEPVTGSTQQGRARDDAGNWFGCDNSVLLRHYPLVDHYLARNPHIAPPSTDVLVPGGDAPDVLYPIGEPTIYTLSGPPGRPTAACGLDFYRDELLGAEYANNAFVAEPVNQLVHREVLAPRGSTFTGSRAVDEADREFLASTDPWFRPVQLRTGLDGCLYVVDMHREIIEHQKFVPEEVLEHANLFGGRDQGRIYRVRRRDAPARVVPRLDQLDDSALVAALDSPNGPQRDLAQQLLVERRATGAAPQLREMVQSAARPLARLHALCALEGLGVLDVETALVALSDADGTVRRHAIRTSEPLLGNAAVCYAALALIRDADPQVRVQLAYTLGELDDERAAAALAQLAASAPDDDYLLAAVWSSVDAANVGAVVAALFAQEGDLPGSLLDAAIELTVALGSEDDSLAAARALVQSTPFEPWQFEATALLLLKTRQRDAETAPLLEVLATMVAAAEQALVDGEGDPSAALPALRLLVASGASAADSLPAVVVLLGPQNPPDVQQAAVELIAALGSPDAGAELIAAWPGFSAPVRAQAFDVLLGKGELTTLLLDAIAAGDLTAVQLDAFQRQRLLTHADESIRTRAAQSLAVAADASRAAVVERYLAASNAEGDAERGRAAFVKHCSSCHRLEEQGNEVGPDLAALSSRTRSSLMESILDPNRAVDERYRSYTALTVEGLSHAGLLAAETSTSVTLVDQVAKRHVILRADLESLDTAGASLMPEGFEQELTPAMMGDLVAYLMSFGGAAALPKGNTPMLATADHDGILSLRAIHADIAGGDIRYEADRQNIGYWIYESDRVAWNIETPQAGEYEVYLEWSCAARDAGSRFVLEGGDQPIKGAVGATAGVDDFRIGRLGSVVLPAGANRLVMQCDGPPKRRHLMDLRALYLVPEDVHPDRVLIGKKGDPNDPAASIAALLEGVAVGTPVEYDRIPAIWQHAKAAGRRNDDGQLIALLELSVPALDEPLADWQAVVIGGGIINGLSEAGAWPQERLGELAARSPNLPPRWERLDDLAKSMAEDVDVPMGTRYDALRIFAAFPWDAWGETLCSYLGSDVHPELQMGAVSSLADFDLPASTQELIAAFVGLDDGNRRIAIEGLMRTEERRRALAKSIVDGAISRDELTPEELEQLAPILQSLER